MIPRVGFDLCVRVGERVKVRECLLLDGVSAWGEVCVWRKRICGRSVDGGGHYWWVNTGVTLGSGPGHRPQIQA